MSHCHGALRGDAHLEIYTVPENLNLRRVAYLSGKVRVVQKYQRTAQTLPRA
jgi:hypothetical protein